MAKVNLTVLLTVSVIELCTTANALAGLNARAMARLYWQSATSAGSSNRNSTASTAQFVVTLSNVKNFRGADLQLLINGPDSVPAAWQAQLGGCASGAAELRPGGYGGTIYRNIFTASPAVPGVLTAQNTFLYGPDSCRSPDNKAVVWLSAAGSAAATRDTTIEYAVFAFRIDLTGASSENGISCNGDLADPLGPIGVCVRPYEQIPCVAPHPGAVLEVLDGNGDVDYIPFSSGFETLTWWGGGCAEVGTGLADQGSPPGNRRQDLGPSITRVSPDSVSADSWTAFTVLGNHFTKDLRIFLTNKSAGSPGMVEPDSVVIRDSTGLSFRAFIPNSLARGIVLQLGTPRGNSPEHSVRVRPSSGIAPDVIAALDAIARPAAVDEYNRTSLPRLQTKYPAARLTLLDPKGIGPPTRVELLPDGAWLVTYGGRPSGITAYVWLDSAHNISRIECSVSSE